MGRFIGDGISFPYVQFGLGEVCLLDYVIDMNNTNDTGGVHLHSIPIVVKQSGFDHTLGIAPGVRLCSLSGLSDAQEVTNSGETWKIFPVRRRGLREALNGALTPINQTNTLNLGFAYKKV
jgi:hypothetical protein